MFLFHSDIQTINVVQVELQLQDMHILYGF